MCIRWHAAVPALVLLIVPSLARGQTAWDLLEKAVYQEKTAGDLDAAIKIYRQVIEQDKASRSAVAQAYYRLGLCLAKKGENGQAAEAFQTVINDFSDQEKLVAVVKKELEKIGPATTRPAGATATAPARHPMALLDEQTRKEVEHFEQSFRAYFQQDARYLRATEDEQAAMVEKWIMDAKSVDFAARTRAISMLGNIRAQAAVEVLLEIVDEPMNNHRPKWMAVRSLGKIGDPMAVPALIEMVDHGNVNTKVYSRLALAELTGVYFGENKAQWRKWWKERGQQVSAEDRKMAEDLAAQAWKAWGSGKHVEAERLFQQALTRDPSAANSWNGLGWAQFNQRRPLAAKVSFQKALERDARHAGALNGMGQVAKSQGKIDEAIDYWKKAVEALPTAIAPLSGLAETCLELKQYDEAVKYFELWLKAEPNSPQAKAGLDKAKAARPK